MRKFFHLLTLICFGLLQSFNQVFAQVIITGEIINEAGRPVREIKISIGKSIYYTTPANGTFKVSPKEDISKVGIEDIRLFPKSFKIKELIYTESSRYAKIIIQPNTRLKVSVVDENNPEHRQFKVVLVSLNDAKPAITDNTRTVEINVAGFTVDAGSRFKINDEEIPADYVKFTNNFGDAFIRLKKIPKNQVKTVEKIFVKDEKGNPLKSVKLLVDGKNFSSNEKGEVKIEGLEASDRSLFLVNDYIIVKADYKAEEKSMTLSIKEKTKEDKEDKPVEEKKEENIETNFTKITDELLEDRKQQKERADRIKKDIGSLTGRLSKEKNTNPEHQTMLANLMASLEQTFNENDEIYQKLQQETKAEMRRMKAQIYKTDSLRNLAEEKVEQITAEKKELEAEKKLAEIRFRSNLMIVSAIAFSLLILAIVFYLYNRKIQKQKNELQIIKNELDEKIEEIHQQNEEIRTQRDNIEHQSKQLEHALTQIKSSIISAERIQTAILDKPNEILRHFSEGFIFYQPRDIVSGDFYWYTQKGAEIILAVVDCTGHGVPGAFMTMLGNSLLNQIINENNITEPQKVLKILDEKVQETLHQQERDTSREGMDMVLLNINLYTKKAVFAGAKNPLYYVKDKKMIQVEGSTIPVGSTLFKKNRKFESQTIDLEGGEVFYLVSDGFQDQFGGKGEQRHKYMRKNLKSFLLSNSQLPLDEQKNVIEREFFEWRGTYSQTDDVLLMGIKV